MIVLSGASASGKTEVAKYLQKNFGIVKVITTTTRTPRKGEVNGRDYFFISEKQFQNKIKNNEFVEYTMYNNNYYGSTKDQISDNKVIVIDPQGLKAYASLNNDSVVTFFLDSNETTRYKRMILRGDGEELATKRIHNDRFAFSKDNIVKVDFHIDSENQTIEEVAKDILNKYKSIR